MSHWLLDSLSESRQQALKQATRTQVYRELLGDAQATADESVSRSAEALELAVLDLLLEKGMEEGPLNGELRLAAADAFRMLRAVPPPGDPVQQAVHLLRASALAVLGDLGTDAARWLRERRLPSLPRDSQDWLERTWATVLDVWLRLVRKDGWSDRDAVLAGVACLRDAQSEFELDHLSRETPSHAKATALELVALYHLARAAEIFAVYMTDGVVDGKHQILQLLQAQFDRVLSALSHLRGPHIEPLCRLIAACSYQMADNCIWTVTRAVNSRVTQFVRNLVDRGRGDRVVFDVLPPQRRALAERGLLGSSRRAVVVSLPTSSGKTLIAEFRILQALNQFDHERGWVAYLVPTRTLVNQITRQLRRDLAPLGIVVEQVSPALEVDNIEQDLLMLIIC